MEEESQPSFIDVLDLLFAQESVPIKHLYRLSDLDFEQMAAFRQRWTLPPKSEDNRSRAIWLTLVRAILLSIFRRSSPLCCWIPMLQFVQLH